MLSPVSVFYIRIIKGENERRIDSLFYLRIYYITKNVNAVLIFQKNVDISTKNAKKSQENVDCSTQ